MVGRRGRVCVFTILALSILAIEFASPGPSKAHPSPRARAAASVEVQSHTVKAIQRDCSSIGHRRFGCVCHSGSRTTSLPMGGCEHEMALGPALDETPWKCFTGHADVVDL
jgi:hypothetical protein